MIADKDAAAADAAVATPPPHKLPSLPRRRRDRRRYPAAARVPTQAIVGEPVTFVVKVLKHGWLAAGRVASALPGEPQTAAYGNRKNCNTSQ